MASTSQDRASKRSRLELESSGSAPIKDAQPLMMIDNKPAHDSDISEQGDEASQLVPRAFERLSLTIDPDYVSKLIQAGVVGYNCPPTARLPTLRYYVLSPTNLHAAIVAVFGPYLKTKLYEATALTAAVIDAEVNQITPIVANACMAALYARLRNIHQQFQQYATRYTARPSYNKALELPLPLADAIQNIGVYYSLGTLTKYVCVPTYPENTQNEGRSTQNWSAFEYESYLPQLRQLGIPLKSIDVHTKNGSLWWTYRVEHHENTFDFRCIFPPINYSDHTALLASMFPIWDEDAEEVQSIVTFHNNDGNYPVKLREIPADFKFRAFGALCQAPPAEWSQYLLTL